MKKKIPVSEIRKGMYIAELDRPWIETPFLFQGFEISDDNEIEQLLAHCQTVYIDTEQGLDTDPQDRLGPWHIQTTEADEEEKARKLDAELKEKAATASKRPPTYSDTTALEEELEPAREAQNKTRNIIYSILEDVRLGKSIDTVAAKHAVGDMTESIIRNPDALICLSELKNKDEYTALHSLRVCIFALAFGRHLGYPKAQLNLLGLGAVLHDVGKMRVSNDILNKPEALTEQEFAIMMSHVPEGVKVLQNAKDISPMAIDVARFHHERFDGSGYASGTKGSEISEFGLIGAIVDCYDAITSDRVYHKGMSSHDALKRMYEWRTKDFHPILIEQFIQCMGIYPIGSLVEMNTGSIGVVVTINRKRRLRPKVNLVLTADKQAYTSRKIIDLSTQPEDENGQALEIKKVLASGTYGVSASDYLPIR